MPPAPCENTAMELDSLEIDWDWDFDLFLEDLKSQPTFCSIGAFDSRNDLLDLLLHFALDETSPGKEESGQAPGNASEPRAVVNAVKFFEVVEAFKRFKAATGKAFVTKQMRQDSDSPHINKLANWINKTRVRLAQYDRGDKVHGLSPFVRAVLKEIGFERAQSKKNSWNRHYEELRQYYEEHGHYEDLRSKGTTLENWASRQRTSFKKSKLNVERIRKLELIHFNLRPKIKYPLVRRGSQTGEATKVLPKHSQNSRLAKHDAKKFGRHQ